MTAPDPTAGERPCDADFGYPGDQPHAAHEWAASVQDRQGAPWRKETFRCPGVTAPDPTAGERAEPPCGVCGGLGQVYDGPHIVWRPCRFCATPASPPAVAASTGTSEDVEAQRRALEDWLIDNHWALEAYDFSHALMASDWLAAREAAARAEERERIAQAIEADRSGPWNGMHHEALRAAARIAREVRP